jgi:predicted lipoprotein with Yx(FWY)xxD motif
MITKSTMWLTSIAAFTILAAGCGGGASSSSGSNGCSINIYTIIAQAGSCPSPSPSPMTTASNVPISAASVAPSSSPSVNVPTPLSTATLLGSPGFVNASGFTVYVFDADLTQANASTCNTGCSGVWPPVTPPSGTLPANWTSFQRQDGTMQLAYKTRALYTYTGDSAAGTANGDGITAFGGVWHVARP